MTKQRNINDALSEYRNAMRLNDDDHKVLRATRKKIRGSLRGAFGGAGKVRFLTQGSYRYRTINRPCHTPMQRMDMDDGMYLADSTVHVSPPQLLSVVARNISELCKQEGWRLSTEKPSCVRVIVSSDKHVDIPVYRAPDAEMQDISEYQHTPVNEFLTEWGLGARFAAGTDKVQLAHRTDGWKDSDPRNIIRWVSERTLHYGKRYLHLCRILKGWRDHQWPQKSPLSSILIMAIVDAAMREGRVEGDMPDDEFLYQVVCVLEAVLNKGVSDPDESVQKSLTDSMSIEDKQECICKFRELRKSLHNAMYGEDDAACLKKLREVFGRFFPTDDSFVQKCKVAAATAITATTSSAKARPYAAVEEYGDLNRLLKGKATIDIRISVQNAHLNIKAENVPVFLNIDKKDAG